MNRNRFYTYIIVIFVALVWPLTAAGEDLPLTSYGKVPRIPEALQQQIQQQTEALQQQIENYFDTFEFIPAVLLLNAILLTYFWSILNRKIQCIIFFVFGFTLIGPLISFLIKLLLNPNQSEETIFLIGGLIGGLFAFVSYWIGWMFSKIALFFGGAILPILFLSLFVHLKLLEHLNLFDQMNNIKLILIGLISAFSGFAMLKLNQYKIVEIVTSAIVGAASIGYLLLWTNGLSNYEILNELKEKGKYVLKNIEDENQIILIVILAVTGVIVQAALLAITRRYKVKSASKSKDEFQIKFRFHGA